MYSDVVIIGAGAAGMMCAIEAGKRGRSVLLLDHAKKPGEKIRISGGGRCNFTNSICKAENFISANPHFVKSALAQYSADDFIAFVDGHEIAWHEKALGQLFCDNRSDDIINILLHEMEISGVRLMLNTTTTSIGYETGKYILDTNEGVITCSSLVIATGGKSIPKMGASGFGYAIAGQFGLNVTNTRPALVPFTFDQDRLKTFTGLSGIAFDSRASVSAMTFEEAALFTHRGLSGPAMLQISSYWREGDNIEVVFSDAPKLPDEMNTARAKSGKQEVHNWLSGYFPSPLAQFICREAGVDGRLGDLTKVDIERLGDILNCWKIKPAGSEGYRTAEVTLGGIDTNDLNSRTMESRHNPGLFFIGEVVDVTGWLGGYNFQWAWSSGWAAGQVV